MNILSTKLILYLKNGLLVKKLNSVFQAYFVYYETYLVMLLDDLIFEVRKSFNRFWTWKWP